MQGFKLSRAIITFAKQPQHTQETYTKFLEIAKKEIPSTRIHPDLHSLEMYNKHKKALFYKYCQSLSMVKQPTDLHTYRSRVLWKNN